MVALVELDLDEHSKRVAAALKVAPAAMKRELRASNTRTAKEAQRWARAAEMAGTPAQRHMATAIRGVGTSNAAILRIVPRGRTAGANPVYWGSSKRTGWNARHTDSRPQHPAPIGFAWKPATFGQGPYAINDALARHLSDMTDIYLAGQVQALARAFPYALAA